VFEWDIKKAKANWRKHKIDFADAGTIFEDEIAITIADGNLDEERFITIGRDALGRVLVVAYTWRDENIRLISARKATAQEREEYEESL
jgi:uncharacterized DUF497 family protein